MESTQIGLAFTQPCSHDWIMPDPRYPTARQRLRHQLISAWRGCEEGPMIELPTQNVSDLVGKIIAQAGLQDRMKLEEILAAWKEIVGDFIARNSTPDSIQRGILTVRVLQPTVHHALSMEKPRILKRLQAKLQSSGIKDIRLKHG